MSTVNPFDLLGDDDAVDPAVLLAIAEKKAAAAAPVQANPVQDPVQGKKGQVQKNTGPPAKGNNKPRDAVRDSRNDGPRGERGERNDRGGFRGDRGERNDRGGFRGDRGERNDRGGFRGDRGGPGGFKEPRENENAVGNKDFSGGYSRPTEDGGERRPYNGPRTGGGGGGFRGGRRGGYSNGDSEEGGERPRRTYDRHSGSGRGNPNEFKREGGGRANWGTQTDELAVLEIEEPVNEGEKAVDFEKQADEALDANKESPVKEQEKKEPEPEENEMTLEEYEKSLEEKRKALLALSLKSEERKVAEDKELKSMLQLSNKKNNDEVFAKLGVDKDNKKKEAAEKAKKSVSINEFLKPAEGENYRSGGRGRGRGRGGRGGFNDGNNNEVRAHAHAHAHAPSIKDDRQFPSLGGK